MAARSFRQQGGIGSLGMRAKLGILIRRPVNGAGY